MSGLITVTLEQQISAVQREIAMRERVYPKWVEQKKLLESKANYEISAMKAVLRTLQELKNNPPADAGANRENT